MQLGVFCPFKYLCGSGFSTLAYLKNKYRAKLESENDMRLSLSIISPRIDRLCGLHHAQILLRQVSPLSTHTHVRTHPTHTSHTHTPHTHTHPTHTPYTHIPHTHIAHTNKQIHKHTQTRTNIC